ncbi:ABC transporter permease [Neobacillus niacini]|uniref:ABC transporter permease n=1 Tax=Neobacillus niacini TaxID=86668 RepID=UPI0021CB318C|nr:ABC transporter permease [Neobacillus niacini]MCM3767732.1 ABC transporter permease [Neobacillus niacini]
MKFLVRRLLVAIPTVFITLTIIFFALRVLPGDPALVILGENASEDALKNLRQQMGLDLPVWQQYLHYLGNILSGDFGESIASGTPVMTLIADNFLPTITLSISSIVVGCILGIPIGILSALKPNSWIDSFMRVVSFIWLSSPPFLLGILLILAFSLKLNVFPSMGSGEGFWGSLFHLILPTFTLGLILSGVMMRFARASMLEEINQDYIRTAKAKGIPNKVVIFKHALRNSLIPVITVIGIDITALISGAVITETIFSRPGLGSLAVGAIVTRDFAILQGCLILFALLVIFVNLIVDVSYSFVNPKIRPR